jgi:hypothetical protein
MRRQHIPLAIISVLALGMNSNAASAHNAGFHLTLIKPAQKQSQFADALLNLHKLEIQKSGGLAEIELARSLTRRADFVSHTGIIHAAHDEVSAQIAALFAAHGRHYLAISAQAADIHNQFVDQLEAGSKAYQLAEAENLGHGHDPVVDELVQVLLRAKQHQGASSETKP